MFSPTCVGQEPRGRITNTCDGLILRRAKKTTRSTKVTIHQPGLCINDPELSISRKKKVRVHTLVDEYLAAQWLQLLGWLVCRT